MVDNLHSGPSGAVLRRSLLGTLLLAATATCTESTRPLPPVGSITLTPTTIAIGRGAGLTLVATTRDSAGTSIAAPVTWTSSAPTIATVSQKGVVSALAYGAVTIYASTGVESTGVKSAATEVVVIAPATTSAYTVREVPSAASVPYRSEQLTDSGDVLLGHLVLRGVVMDIPGCTPVALNNLSHVLCSTGTPAIFSTYGIWRGGVLTPLVQADSFKAAAFSAHALNDSGVVVGMYYNPAFSNANCSSSTTCVVLWKNGEPTFLKLSFSWSGAPTHLNNRLDLVLQERMFAPTHYSSTELYNAATGQHRTITRFARSINNQGWVAAEREYVNTYPRKFGSDAMVALSDTTIKIGPGAATGINDAGTVVGTLEIGPFRWTKEEGASLMAKASTDPSWTITTALRINNRGQILAQANHADGRQGRWVLLTPTAP
ncbi:MAG: Ig-like domain-containing protein [Gemmatimonadaceae bacterium]